LPLIPTARAARTTLVINAKLGAIRMAEIELGKITFQVLLTDMVMHPLFRQLHH
jgi:hypothetical protein